jgi:hypothetical protein
MRRNRFDQKRNEKVKSNQKLEIKKLNQKEKEHEKGNKKKMKRCEKIDFLEKSERKKWNEKEKEKKCKGREN